MRRPPACAFDLKWPNDLQVARRKLAGILAEASGNGVGDSVIVGYGINVAATAFPPELRDRATSLESELGRGVDRAHVLVETLAALARRYDDLLDGRFDAILDAWRALAPAASGARVKWTTLVGDPLRRHGRHRRPRRAARARRRSDRANRLRGDRVVVTESDYCREIEAYLCRKNDGHLIRVVGPSFDLVSAGPTRACRSRWRFRESIGTSSATTGKVRAAVP